MNINRSIVKFHMVKNFWKRRVYVLNANKNHIAVVRFTLSEPNIYTYTRYIIHDGKWNLLDSGFKMARNMFNSIYKIKS